MQKQYILEDDVNRVLSSMNTPGSEDKGEPEEYDVYIEEDRITVVKRPEPQPQVIEAVKPPHAQPQPYFAYTALLISVLLLSYLVTSAFLSVFFPPTVTVTLLAKEKSITAAGTIQLPSRHIPPITVTQSQSAPATGRGHQNAASATGTVTFYNGQFQNVTIQEGTILSVPHGVQVITDQNAVIPAADINPPAFGQITVSAHALHPGSNGNIAAYAINAPCCFASVIAKNPENFTGGQDERNFQTVARQDIETISAPLKRAVAQSMRGALQGQEKPQEQLFLLPCTPTVASDHQPGAEAREVTVTVSETCSAVTFDAQSLETKAIALLSRLAARQLGTGYSLAGNVHITEKQATITHPPSLVLLSFQAQGTWMYALSQTAREHIKVLIAGKSKQYALHMLRSLPGIEQAAMQWGDGARLPKDTRNIRLVLLFTA